MKRAAVWRILGSVLRGVVVALASARIASAQAADRLPLAQIKDDTQLADAIGQLANDPAIAASDPQRRVARALIGEGAKRLRAKSYDQALANFLAAYVQLPSPRILLEIAATLRDMARLADAANTYQRYLAHPAADRIAEVHETLTRLDAQLTILTLRVVPRGSEISIDAGPFIAVGGTLVTRVRPGIHLVRIRNWTDNHEITVNGFEGEQKQVTATLPVGGYESRRLLPEHQDGWLITGRYASDGTIDSNSRKVFAASGELVLAITPEPDPPPVAAAVRVARESIAAGMLGVLRIDAEGRGFAGGLGVAIARGRFAGDVLVLRSNVTGGYLGMRYRFLAGVVRPYAAIGVPGFVFDTPAGNGVDAETKLAVGARAAAGVEFHINRHLSLQADFGFEHFWFVDDTRFVDNVWVPTLGAIGRL